MPDHARNIVALYERHARLWAEDRQSRPWIERAWHERFVAALPPHASVLDLGCGCGWPVAELLAAHGTTVTGVDSSATMIELCREHLPAETWINADMRGLRLGRHFDGIVAWDSFFHLSPEDQRGMFATFAGHAAPRCLLMFNTGPKHSTAMGIYGGEPLYHSSLDAAEYRALLEDARFDVMAHAVETADAGGRTVWFCRRRD